MNLSAEMQGVMCNYTAGRLEKQLLPVMYSLISLQGLLANGLMLSMFQKQLLRKCGVYTYLINLTVADLIICLVLPFRVVLLIKGDSWTQSSGKCITLTMIINFGFYCTLACRTLCLIFIGFSRYAIIVKFHHKKLKLLYEPRFAKYTSIAFWIAGILIVTVCSIYMSRSMGASKSLCYGVTMYSQLPANFTVLNAFSILFLFILIALVLLYVLVFVYLSRARKTVAAQKNRWLYRKSQLRICVAVFTCILCQLPYFSYQLASNIHRAFYNDCHVLVTMQRAKILLLWLVSLNSCLDPILFIAIQKFSSMVNSHTESTGKCHEMETASHTN
ncbi:cysteinyl leukotriene receptor 1-like [Amblyraja radiata]|uniref:cysteinyl leukotriene receptor 1-like n=1 Tax=Amblyraja radiata TaxID=386614 RepID=UPI001403021A|nr:cysteinyl leukotriene receptor 1-like [Amblyraja radiata]XP_032904625.1 cysteinyl leukotriene receptor 1-like [Amblyraja radiata]